MAALNSSIATLLIAKQYAIDTVPSSGIHRLQWIDGNINSNRVVLDQEVFDGVTYSSPRSVTGRFETSGTIKVLPDNAAVSLLTAGVLGVDSASSNETVLSTDNPGEGDYYTIWTEVGQGSNVVRRRFVNCKISAVKITGQASSQFVELEATIVGIDPQAKVDSLPSVNVEPTDSYTFADGSGAYVVSTANGPVATAGINSWEVSMIRDQEPYQGDSLGYYTVVAKRGRVEMACTVIADEVSLPILNKIWYGTSTPVDGQQPSAELFEDSFSFVLSRGLDSLEISLPAVRYRTDSAVDPNLAGDAIELPLQGRAVAPESGSLASVTVSTQVVD